MTATVEYHDTGEHELATSAELRDYLNAMAFTITAHAVPHSGVDTGRLIGSMSHAIKTDSGSFVAVLGSGTGDGVDAVYYAAPHWAGRTDPSADKPATDEVRGRRIPHPTKPGPTKPYSKAMRELGITYTVEPGGFEA